MGGCGQLWELKVFYQFAFNKSLLQGIFVARLLACWPAILDALIVSFIFCPLCPHAASKGRKGAGRSSWRQTDGHGERGAAGRAELRSELTCGQREGRTGRGRRKIVGSVRGQVCRVNENCRVGGEGEGGARRAGQCAGQTGLGCPSSPAPSGAQGPSAAFTPSCSWAPSQGILAILG